MNCEPDHRRITQVRIGGFGGQGVVLAGTLLGCAAVKDGFWASGSNAYGAQARGGAARSEVVISNRPIVFPHVLRADVLVVLSQAAYDAFSGQLAETGALVVHDAALVAVRPLEGVRQVGIPATETAVAGLRNAQAANLVILGAAAALTGVVSREALETAVKDQIPPRLREPNLEALDHGWTLGKEKR